MRKLLAAILALALAPAVAWAEGEDPAPADAPEAAEETKAEPEVKPASASVPATASTAAAAPAAPSATLVASPEKRAAQKPFRVGVSLGNSVGSGTFTGEGYHSYVGSSLGLSPSYSFKVQDVALSASGRVSAGYEFTAPNNSLGRHFNWNDIGLNLSAPTLYKNELTGITVSPGLGLTLPVSRESIWRGSITNLSASLGLGRAFGKFNLGGSLGASKTFYGQVTQTVSERQRTRTDELNNQVFLCRSDAENCGLRGVPSLWAVSAGLNASYAVMDKLSLSMGLNLSKRRAYSIPVDEYSSKARDAEGNPVITGGGQSDSMVGTFGASYKVTDTVAASLGMSTAQPVRNSQQTGFRFPWYSPYYTGGYTSYSLGLSTSF